MKKTVWTQDEQAGEESLRLWRVHAIEMDRKTRLTKDDQSQMGSLKGGKISLEGRETRDSRKCRVKDERGFVEDRRDRHRQLPHPGDVTAHALQKARVSRQVR